MQNQKRVFSGARPTGRQHIGNYLGAIKNYVALQESYQCLYCIVDVHALTTLEETKSLQDNIREMVLDWLAAGLDPEKSIIFVQSHVPQVMELHTYLSMVTPLGWLLRVPTFKEKARMQPQNVNYGLVGYPVLMTADIILYKADIVPVGEDQLPHLELAREIVRRFNGIFGDIFPEPEARLTETPLVVGLNGVQKMGKSYGNQVELAHTPEETRQRIMNAVTDPARIHKTDPGHPEVCSVFRLHGLFARAEETARLEEDCRKGAIGCVQCKRHLAEEVNTALTPLRQRRAELAAKPEIVKNVLGDGARRAGLIAARTMKEVREKMNLA
ncbi:MAG: tryptophan--tRNA ligase [Chloroflexi bacterium]|nr:tryptophan--tRNA ligase [Chloroflexota bacterium]